MTLSRLLHVLPSPYRAIARRITYFTLGTILTFLYAELVQAQTPGANAVTRTPYSPETIIGALIAAVISIFFLRGMYLVLTYASATYGIEHEETETSSKENDFLLFGAFAWVVGSALIIAAYGIDWRFLYIGPIICLLGPVVPIVAMELDLKRYKRSLASRRARTSIPDSTDLRA